MGRWPRVRLEELTKVVAMGPFGSSIKVETFVPVGVPVISGQHLHGWTLDSTPGFNFVTSEHADRLRNANVGPGDVVFTHAGNIGQVAMVPRSPDYPRYVISQRQFYARCDESRLLPEFLVAFFKTANGRHQLLANASQVGVPSLARPVTYLRGVEVPAPPIRVQRRIADILGALNDKIELNRQVANTLDSVCQSLFAGLISGRQPETGESSTLGAEFEVTMGQSPPGNTYNTDGVGSPFYQGRVDFGFRYPSRRVYCTSPTRMARAGDVLLSVRAPVGDINIAAEPCAIGRGLAAIRHRVAGSAYTYETLRALRSALEIFNGEGTVFGAIGGSQLKGLRVSSPPRSVIAAFESSIRPVEERLGLIDSESRQLAEVRDSLLPRLLSGELEVAA